MDKRGFITAYGFRLTKTGVDPASFQEDIDNWWRVLGWLFNLQGSIALFIGDLLVGMEKQYGKTYEDVAERFGYEKTTLYNYRRICENVEISFRNENLSISHYNLVAGKTDEEKHYYLDHASQQNMSVSELRQFIKKHELPDTVDSTKPSHLLDAQERFSKHLTSEQFNRMSTDEQIEFWQWWQQQTERIRQWMDR